MPKEIILYNLKDSVTDEEYQKWCEDYKGPVLLQLGSTKSFTLLKMLGGIKGNGKEGIPPEPTKPQFNYIGILDIESLDGWNKDRESKTFKEEFFPQWFSKWVADFYVLGGTEVYYGEAD